MYCLWPYYNLHNHKEDCCSADSHNKILQMQNMSQKVTDIEMCRAYWWLREGKKCARKKLHNNKGKHVLKRITNKDQLKSWREIHKTGRHRDVYMTWTPAATLLMLCHSWTTDLKTISPGLNKDWTVVPLFRFYRRIKVPESEGSDLHHEILHWCNYACKY